MGTISDSSASAQVDSRHWRVVLGRLHATFTTGTFTRGVMLVERIARLAEEANHHPDVDLRYTTVHVRLLSHDAGGLTERDLDLARRISDLADELGIEADASVPQSLEVAIDALDIPAVRSFWKAVLDYDDGPVDEDGTANTLSDRAGIGPTFWFQQMDEPRPQRNRVHIDVSVPHDVAEERVRAAIGAGGHLVRDSRAPAFWVLADAEGNEACVCTWQARD